MLRDATRVPCLAADEYRGEVRARGRFHAGNGTRCLP
jgi:hypothetical protein